MYPALHEPTFAKDVETVYGGNGNDYQNFILRMVIAISLQKMDTQYAGLADSYYLAALKYVQHVIRPMDLKTLQAFALLAEYSLLTPTRTAIYYVMGLAVRLSQALGIHEEKTITRGRGGERADCLEIDMRRRLFWCVWVMELGLAHSLGRPSILATGREHIDVGFFEAVPDEFITSDGVLPGAPRPTLKKWIAIHFFKMRLLQLEMRRKLYLKKRPYPKDDQDPWFQQMNAKLEDWRDASPNNDEGSGLNKIWFIGRYNTMIVMLFRPSPQVSKPTLAAAEKCYDACAYNIYLQREQITMRNVDITWIFTQSIFMAINTLLWTLSYAAIRKKHPREDVEKHLVTAMDAISQCASRWPGVSSAMQLYEDLIHAIMKIYDKDGDIQLPDTSPSDTASPQAPSEQTNRSRTGSPATLSTSSLATPPDKLYRPSYFSRSRQTEGEPPSLPFQANSTPPPSGQPQSPPAQQPLSGRSSQSGLYYDRSSTSPGYPVTTASQRSPPTSSYDPQSQFNPLPTSFHDHTAQAARGWNPAYMGTQGNTPYGSYNSSPANQHALPVQPYVGQSSSQFFTDVGPLHWQDPNALDPSSLDVLNPNAWGQDMTHYGNGLDHAGQIELMQSLETDGMEDIQQMVQNATHFWNSQAAQYQT